MDQRGVFLAALDDDYQAATRIKRLELLSQVRCYSLLAPSILIHPAYVFQSNLSFSFVTQGMSNLLDPSLVQIALGSSESSQSYMAERISSLNSTSTGRQTGELEQYTRWGSELNVTAKQLDEALPSERQVKFGKSRDRMFRDGLLGDLSKNPVRGASLREIALAYFTQREGFGLRSGERCVRILKEFVENAPLVSIDALLVELRKRKYAPLADHPAFTRRLLVLYYQANVDDGYIVGGISALDPTIPVIHPYDDTLFWAVLERVFGASARHVLALDSSPGVERFILDLRTTDLWLGFVERYTRLQRFANSVIQEAGSEVAAAIEDDYGYTELKLMPRVWRSKKADLSVAIAGVGTSAATLSIEPVAIAAMIAAVAGAGLTLYPLRKFRRELSINDLHRLKGLVKSSIDLNRARREMLRFRRLGQLES